MTDVSGVPSQPCRAGSGAGWRDQVCVGEGGYVGLTAYIHAISGNAASDFGILGWIEETP